MITQIKGYKNIIILLFLVMLCSFFFLKKREYNFLDFRTGTFEIKSDYANYIVSRDNIYQTEKIEGTKGFIKYNIKWLSDRKYFLIYDSNTLEDDALRDKYNSVKDTIIVELNRIEGGYCFFEVSLGKRNNYKEKMRKIN